MDGGQPQNYKGNIITPHTSHRVSPSFLERQRNVPRIGDIWIPKFSISLHHFTKLYIPGVENLF